ncbi:MAG: hypothetical protein VX951_11595 [Planctomycetota bacterium]|nr:hypothetical protein [Planctomycetota bacterium]
MRYPRALALLLVLAVVGAPNPDRVVAGREQARDSAAAQSLLDGIASPFVPNLGQWNHRARFVHRSGPMTVFLEDRGWVLDLVERLAKPGASPGQQKTRGVALQMRFEGAANRPTLVGEGRFAGHHDYLLGTRATRWRSEVPLYASVLYEELYPGIDLRLRQAKGVPEYDLMLQPGADLSRVSVCVEGGTGMALGRDGSLVIETALGDLVQPVPRTWQVAADGETRQLDCSFVLLGANSFGFVAPGWDGDSRLTIDPGLLWSTYLGGTHLDHVSALRVDDSGVVTVTGYSASTDFPTSLGAYDTSHNASVDAFVSRLDPSLTGTAQLLYSSYLGGSSFDRSHALSVDAGGVVTVVGFTNSGDFPTTAGAYDTSFNGPGWDAFVSRLDPSRSGAAQLVYSTFLGGSGNELGYAVQVDAGGVITVVGDTASADFPTSSGAFDTTSNGRGTPKPYDVFVSRLDPSRTGTAQLSYSTYLGGINTDRVQALRIDAVGVVTLAGFTNSANFPTSSGAYDTSLNLGTDFDVFVSRLDPRRTGRLQLVYSTFLGGRISDYAYGLWVDAAGVVTLTGTTSSTDFPTTPGAFDRLHNGSQLFDSDGFVSRLDPRQNGNAQLVYSSFVGGDGNDVSMALWVDDAGVMTVAGYTGASDFPTTSGAYSTAKNGGDDAFVSRLDPRQAGNAQLVYSTFLGGNTGDRAFALRGDAAGLITVAGYSDSSDFPTTSGAFDTTYSATGDAFVSRLSMGVALHADRYELPLTQAGTQNLRLDAGVTQSNRLYAIFGSATGTRPGIPLNGIHIPLNVDPYTSITIGSAVPPMFVMFQGVLGRSGQASASFHVPAGLPALPPFTLHHAYVVFDRSGGFHMASNAVPLRLK